MNVGGAAAYVRALADAWRGDTVHLHHLTLVNPGPRTIRIAAIGGNIRMHRLIDETLPRGGTFVDAGANIGVNTLYAAARVGDRGRVVAIEPAPDNLAVLDRNIAGNHADNVTVVRGAAGAAAGKRELYVRGDVSAVNSLFPDSCYAEVTAVLPVAVHRLDDVVDGEADVIKIDVEGGEHIELAGAGRLLATPRVVLLVEWHPLLQEAAGHAAEALPRSLIDRGFRLDTVSHVSRRPLAAAEIVPLAASLRRARKPIELLARR